MLLDLLDMSYQSRSSDQNQAQLVNMYLESDEAKGKYKIVAYPMPGLTTFCDTGKLNVRELYEFYGTLYAVAGNTLYSISSVGSATIIGTLNTNSGYAKMRGIAGGGDSNHQLVIIDKTKGYSYNTGTTTATFPIADVDFPQTAIDLENQDDYILAVKPSSIAYQISGISDSLDYPALDFASKIGQADNINAILSHESMIWLFGSKSTEVWSNTGNSLFPFERSSNTFLHYGTPASKAIAVNGTYFIGLISNGRGGYTIAQTQPRLYYYNPSPVSTPAIENLIQANTSVSDATAFITNHDGHEFYTITFPTDNYTLVYDVPKSQQSDSQKGAWYYRKSLVNSSYGQFLGSGGQAFCYGKNFVGDYQSGKIYYQDSTNYTENSTPILRQLITPPGSTYQGGKRVFLHHMQIDVETGIGSNMTFTLEKSLDNGLTWILVNTFTVPAKGGRLYQNRLGSTRYGMIFRLSTTMNAKFCILGFQVEASLGHS